MDLFRRFCGRSDRSAFPWPARAGTRQAAWGDPHALDEVFQVFDFVLHDGAVGFRAHADVGGADAFGTPAFQGFLPDVQVVGGGSGYEQANHEWT